jgi:hypothetical protein
VRINENLYKYIRAKLNMQNKRGQELSTTAIILIILGVLILVILIVGFALGWNRIAPWLSRDNVNQVVDGCNTACTTKSVYDFCLRGRDMTAEKVDYKALTCNYVANQMQTDTGKNFGVVVCEDLLCANVVLLPKSEVDLTTLCTGNSGKYIQAYKETTKTLGSYSCPLVAPAA